MTDIATVPLRPPGTRWFARAFAVAAIGASLLLDLSAWIVVPVLFVLVVPFEKLFPRHRDQRVRRPLAGLDTSYALAAPAFNVIAIAVAIVVGFASLAWIPGLMIRPFVAMIPPALLPFVGIALFDVAIYWVHRWSHEVPALWRFHSVHHSTEHLDWVSGFRNHPFDGAIVAPPFFFLLAAGFDATFTGALAIDPDRAPACSSTPTYGGAGDRCTGWSSPQSSTTGTTPTRPTPTTPTTRCSSPSGT